MIEWPAYILMPEPLNESYAQALPSRIARQDMDQGPGRQRRTVRNAPTQLQVSWPFSADEYRVFTGFVDAVDGGFFSIPVFRDNAYVSVTAQFVKDSVRPTRSGGEWIVAAVLETMDRLAPDATELASLLWTAGTDTSFSDIGDLLHHIVHTELPAAMP